MTPVAAGPDAPTAHAFALTKHVGPRRDLQRTVIFRSSCEAVVVMTDELYHFEKFCFVCLLRACLVCPRCRGPSGPAGWT